MKTCMEWLGLGNSGNARKKTFFSRDVFPKVKIFDYKYLFVNNLLMS